jgi:Leucine-rich repeat (LRR) protein
MYFGNNLIQNIPTNIELYKNLKIISIEDNWINKIPCSLSNFDNIKIDLFSLCSSLRRLYPK